MKAKIFHIYGLSIFTSVTVKTRARHQIRNCLNAVIFLKRRIAIFRSGFDFQLIFEIVKGLFP